MHVVWWIYRAWYKTDLIIFYGLHLCFHVNYTVPNNFTSWHLPMAVSADIVALSSVSQ